MSHVAIYIWKGTEYCFLDMALSIQNALHKRRLRSEIVDQLNPNVVSIIFGANMIRRYSIGPIPPDSIIVNMEQLIEGGYWLSPEYIDLLKTHTVWDYNTSNVTFLCRLLNRDEIPLIRLGHTPMLEFNSRVTQDIDVLFFGTRKDRRQKIEMDLRNAGLNVVFRYDNLFGKEKLLLIARAKIVLNIHCYITALFEIPRIYALLHQQKFVISEVSTDQVEYAHLDGGMIVCSYEEIVTKVNEYLTKPEERSAIAMRGYSIISKVSTEVPLIPGIELLNNMKPEIENVRGISP